MVINLMRDPLLLLKFSYIIGAILDVLVAIQMFLPGVFAATTGIGFFAPGSGYLYASYMSGVLMIGWATLLLWGYRKPVERMQILLITTFPVLIGLMISDILSVMSGFFPWLTAVVYLLIQMFLVTLFVISYFLNRRKAVFAST
jgi:hypothetical protein